MGPPDSAELRPVPALHALLARHYEELVEYLRRRLRDHGLARDAVHDAFVHLLEQPPAALPRLHSPLAFLRRVVLHTAIDRYRSDSTRASLIDLCGDDPMPVDLPGAALSMPELAVAWRQRCSTLLEAIRALPPSSQEIFILTQLHHMPQAEVAARLGISRGMVARHLARALKGIAPALHP